VHKNEAHHKPSHGAEKDDLQSTPVTVDEVSADPSLEEAGEAANRLDPLEELRSERDRLKGERDELKELLLRRQAEFDNFRKRTEKERGEFTQYAGMELVRDLLPVIDDFERARKVEGGSPEYTKGIEMIYTRMLEALKKVGLEPIETAGRDFDPHLHQAVERVETKDVPEGSIVGEFQRGYNFKGKLLRPSMVRVAA
jgi:molecular chaperone GrpE